MNHRDYIEHAFKEAYQGMRTNAGGPFGAIVVVNNEIVGRGYNQVTSRNDPTAHAEIVAIRKACQMLDQFKLNDASIYTTSEPCPMCMSAIYWAGINAVYFSGDRDEAEKAGFIDKEIYHELTLPLNQRKILMRKLDYGMHNELFSEWGRKSEKIQY